MEKINKVVSILKKGGVIICPTDTVYGFLADATQKKAVDKIYSIKKRPKSKPLPLFVSNFKMAKKLGKIDESQEKIIKRYWPGKYTFVVKREKGTKIFGAARGTVALRVPNYRFLNQLLNKFKKPLAQTSVNISGEKSLSDIHDIMDEFRDEKRIGLIIDAGNLKKAKPSTIIDLSNKKIKTLRR